jgi:hypothetical protein
MSEAEKTKLCTKCDEEKRYEAFYRNNSRSDGLQGWCKSCQSAEAASDKGRARFRRYRRSERGRAVQRDAGSRYRASEKGAANRAEYLKSERGRAAQREGQRRYQASEKGSAMHRKHSRRYRLANPEQYKAYLAVSRAVLEGSLVRGQCANEGPGCFGRIEGHHYLGYALEHWLDVQWLCVRHHNVVHEEEF